MARTVAIVLNWRRPQETIDCVTSLVALGRDIDVVVVDNASGDGSQATIEAALAHLVRGKGRAYRLISAGPYDRIASRAGKLDLLVVQAGDNGGYAAGNNVGLRIALARPDCEFIWILNNDTTVADGRSHDALCAKMDADPSIGICGSTVVYRSPEGLVQSWGGGTFNPVNGRCTPIGRRRRVSDPVDEDEVQRRLAYVNGAAAFVRRRFVEKIGPMTEDYFLYYEEIDWAWRAKGRFGLGYAADSEVVHTVGGTIGTDEFGNASPLSRYYFARNTLKFLARRWPIALPAAVIMLTRELVVELWRGRPRNARAIWAAFMGQPFPEQAPATPI